MYAKLASRYTPITILSPAIAASVRLRLGSRTSPATKLMATPNRCRTGGRRSWPRRKRKRRRVRRPRERGRRLREKSRPNQQRQSAEFEEREDVLHRGSGRYAAIIDHRDGGNQRHRDQPRSDGGKGDEIPQVIRESNGQPRHRRGDHHQKISPAAQKGGQRTIGFAQIYVLPAAVVSMAPNSA